MSQPTDERVIYQCKLHRGILLLPIAPVLFFMIPTAVNLWTVHLFLGQAGPMGQNNSALWLLFTLPFLFGLALGMGLFLVVLFKYLKSEVVLTENSLKFCTGWLSIGTTEILLSRIETLTLWEPLVGRLLGYGTVSVTGTGGAVFPLRFLPKSQYLHSLLKTMINPGQPAPAQKRENVSQQLNDLHARYMPKE